MRPFPVTSMLPHPGPRAAAKLAGGFMVAAAAAAFIACDPGSGTGASAGYRSDLQKLANQVRYLTPPSAGKDAGLSAGGGLNGLLKRGSFKRAADPACDAGEVIEESMDTTASGGVGVLDDTTRYYTGAGNLRCSEDEAIGWITVSSHSRDALDESWISTRIDYPSGGGDYLLKMTGTGKLRYLSGYGVDIKSLSVIVGATGDMREFKMTLGLEDGMEAPLDLLSGSGGGDLSGLGGLDTAGASSDAVALQGPIQKASETIGQFQIRNDDRVVIEGADQKVISPE